MLMNEKEKEIVEALIAVRKILQEVVVVQTMTITLLSDRSSVMTEEEKKRVREAVALCQMHAQHHLTAIERL